MDYIEECTLFGEKLAALLSITIKRKTKLKHVRQNSSDIEFYISVEEEILQKIYDYCKKFSFEQKNSKWNHHDKPFIFNGLVELDNGEVSARYIISEKTLNIFEFDENLINSVKAVNKYNL